MKKKNVALKEILPCLRIFGKIIRLRLFSTEKKQDVIRVAQAGGQTF